MNKTEVIQTIKEIGVIPVVRASSEEKPFRSSRRSRPAAYRSLRSR